MRISTQAPGMQLPPETVQAKRTVEKADPAPVQTMLFGSVMPKPLDISQFPQLLAALRWLQRQKVKIASFLGEPEQDYDITLCEGEVACIDAEGHIFIGEALMQRVEKEPDLLAGILAHEIGHRPRSWKKMNKRAATMSRPELVELARNEEGKADHNAGRALASLGLSAEPLCAYLEAHGNFEKQPELYHPVDVRVAIIRDAHTAQSTRKATSKRLFGGFHTPPDAKDIVADGAPARRRS